MKALIIGNYQENSGYSDSIIGHINALSSVGVDIVIRPLNMLNQRRELPNSILNMERKSLSNIDIVIQHSLPNVFSYKGGVQNVGCYCYETNSLDDTNWRQNIELMDKMVTLCSHDYNIVKEIKRPAIVIPHAFDCDKFKKQYKSFKFANGNPYIFYIVGEYNKRKNVPAILISYFTAFSSSDNVLLVLKLNGVPKDAIKKVINDIRMNCKRFATMEHYPKVVLICDYLKEEELLGLHQSCDCFISASHGESFCIPAAEAAGFGNTLLLNQCGSFIDFFELGLCSNIIKSSNVPVFGVENAPKYLYSSNESWRSISTSDLAEQMRNVYNKDHQLTTEHRKTQSFQNAVFKNFSYSAVGNRYKSFLEAK